MGNGKGTVVPALLILMIALMFTSPSVEEETVMRGFGAHSCAQFVADYKKNPQMTLLLWGTWAQGFMAAMNVQLALEHKARKNIPAIDDVEETMRKMCAERAPSPFWTVVLDYFKSLRELP